MGSVTNISGETLESPVLRCVVADQQTIDDVDDALLDPAFLVWPQSHWLVNGEPQRVIEPPVPPNPDGGVEIDPISGADIEPTPNPVTE
jgi:hypothetical protein